MSDSDSEVDHELLDLLRESLNARQVGNRQKSETGVLRDAKFICDNSVDVAIDYAGTKAAAAAIWQQMQEKSYTTKSWTSHPLHPKTKSKETVDFIFTLDLLNFSFWPDSSAQEPFTVEYRDTTWTGYWSLVALLQRALDEGVPITTPSAWYGELALDDDSLRHCFRSCSTSEIPLLDERIACLRNAGRVLTQHFGGSFVACIQKARESAAALVNLIVKNFPDFQDEAVFEDTRVQFYKRAQILVADLWACFEGQDYGKFNDVDDITMFADYRIPQVLHALGCLKYSPSLESQIKHLRHIPSGSAREIQLRGCSIWCVELIRREIVRVNPHGSVNSILIDFFLYDLMKQREAEGSVILPHHRTRSIWY